MSRRVRPAAVAGLFYPGEARQLGAEIDRYLQSAPPAKAEGIPKAIIAPHAGYIYSAPIAAAAYARIAPLRGLVRRVVLAGPAHRVYVPGIAIPSATHFASPLGEVALDAEALAALASLPFVEVSDRAHEREHSLEVHVPFLQAVLGTFSLVPLVVGDASPRQVAQAFERLWGGPETLIVVSSDLSHYLPYEAARACDRDTARAIAGGKADLHGEQACGAAPINGLLVAAREHGLRIDTLDVRNSGDTAGERDRVVGYASFALVEPGAAAHG